jgi:hypothetical protein
MVADGFEKAVIGFSAYQPGRLPTVIYDYEECIAVLMNRDDMEYAEAVEYMEFNVTGAWFGEGTPIFMHRKSVR